MIPHRDNEHRLHDIAEWAEGNVRDDNYLTIGWNVMQPDKDNHPSCWSLEPDDDDLGVRIIATPDDSGIAILQIYRKYQGGSLSGVTEAGEWMDVLEVNLKMDWIEEDKLRNMITFICEGPSKGCYTALGEWFYPNLMEMRWKLGLGDGASSVTNTYNTDKEDAVSKALAAAAKAFRETIKEETGYDILEITGGTEQEELI